MLILLARIKPEYEKIVATIKSDWVGYGYRTLPLGIYLLTIEEFEAEMNGNSWKDEQIRWGEGWVSSAVLGEYEYNERLENETE
jgi:hypothetical protein